MNERLEARLKQDTRYGSMQFFSRHEYVKYEWREIPAGFEQQARSNEYLETRLMQAPSEEPAEEIKPGNSIAGIDMTPIGNEDDQIIDDILSGIGEEEEEEKPAKRSTSRKASKKEG